jgi:electron transfer flavoprotein alpha subunit
MTKRNVLVLPEIKKGELDSTALGLLAKGRESADQTGSELIALLVGSGLSDILQSLRHAGPDRILVADHPALAAYNPEIYVNLISKVIDELKPGFLFLAYTHWGMELGPALAQRSGAYMISNCADLEIEGSLVRAVRPMFGGSYHARIELQTQRPYVVSFQRGVFPAPKNAAGPAEAIQVPVEIEVDSLRSKVVGTVAPPEGDVDITKAEIIVSVGRGIGEEGNIPMIKELADALGGSIACSRPVSDLGWLPKAYHVGISGKTVAPKRYIACGISGSGQHVAGMESSEIIIAINKDAKAPIFNVAHYGIVGDLFEIVPELTRRAKESREMEGKQG